MKNKTARKRTNPKGKKKSYKRWALGFLLMILVFLICYCTPSCIEEKKEDQATGVKTEFIPGPVKEKSRKETLEGSTQRPDRPYTKDMDHDFLIVYQKQLKKHLKQCDCEKDQEQKILDISFLLDTKEMTVLDFNLLADDKDRCWEGCFRRFAFKGKKPDGALKYPIRLVLSLF